MEEKYIKDETSPTGYVKQIVIDVEARVLELKNNIKYCKNHIQEQTVKINEFETQLDAIYTDVPEVKLLEDNITP